MNIIMNYDTFNLNSEVIIQHYQQLSLNVPIERGNINTISFHFIYILFKKGIILLNICFSYIQY